MMALPVGVFLLAVLLVFTPPALKAQTDSSPPPWSKVHRLELEGMYLVTVNGGGVYGLPDPVHLLWNFNRGGSLIFTDDLAPGPLGKQSMGHGTWTRTGKGKYFLEVYHFLFDEVSGAPTGMMTWGRANIEFDDKEDSFTGTNRIEFVTTDGLEPIAPPLFVTLEGKRCVPVPVPTAP